MAMRSAAVPLLVAASLCGCVSVREEAIAARNSLAAGEPEKARAWSVEMATDSSYSKNLGAVEAGRVCMLSGDGEGAAKWFRQAIDSAIDRQEREPKIKLGDVGNAVLASTITDDRTREYYLPPYELNFALQYAILAGCLNGDVEDALVDARLSVYVQDNLAQTYGADVRKPVEGDNAQANQASGTIVENQSEQLAEMMAATRNSWENPALWWLTGVLFEANGETDMAWQSYRKARAVRPECPVFARDAARADAERKAPAPDKARLVVLYEDGWAPLRESLTIPVPLYTGFGIQIPTYRDKSAHMPKTVSVSGASGFAAASPAVDVRALAARDLSEQLPGVVVRNVTRAAVQAAAQAAVNASGNEYAQIGVFVANAVVSAMREADTRSWSTLPDGQQVWADDAMAPGNYQIGVNVDGRTVAVPVTLGAGETALVWIADLGRTFRTGTASLSGGGKGGNNANGN